MTRKILFWPTVKKKCSSNQEKLLKFKGEGWECLISFEQFDRTVKGQNNFWLQNAFLYLFLEVSQTWKTRTIQIRKKFWDWEIVHAGKVRKCIFFARKMLWLISKKMYVVKLLIDNRHFIMSVGTIEILRISDNFSLLLHLFAILG